MYKCHAIAEHTVTISYKGIDYKGKSIKWERFQCTLYYVLYRKKSVKWENRLNGKVFAVCRIPI